MLCNLVVICCAVHVYCLGFTYFKVLLVWVDCCCAFSFGVAFVTCLFSSLLFLLILVDFDVCGVYCIEGLIVAFLYIVCIWFMYYYSLCWFELGVIELGSWECWVMLRACLFLIGCVLIG